VDRTQKEATVAALNAQLQQAAVIVITKQSGMTVAESTDLRRKMRAAGASFKVTKNRLARIALQGTPFASTVDLFKGPTAIAYSSDPVSAAKVAVEYAKANQKFEIVGGSIGSGILDAQGVESLSKLPSLDELRAMLVGMLQQPATKVASILQQPGASVARVLSAYATKDEAA